MNYREIKSKEPEGPVINGPTKEFNYDPGLKQQKKWEKPGELDALLEDNQKKPKQTNKHKNDPNNPGFIIHYFAGDSDGKLSSLKPRSNIKPEDFGPLIEHSRIVAERNFGKRVTSERIPNLQPKENYPDILKSVYKMTEGQRVIENTLKILPNLQPRQN
jgi:hypothetical protein